MHGYAKSFFWVRRTRLTRSPCIESFNKLSVVPDLHERNQCGVQRSIRQGVLPHSISSYCILSQHYLYRRFTLYYYLEHIPGADRLKRFIQIVLVLCQLRLQAGCISSRRCLRHRRRRVLRGVTSPHLGCCRRLGNDLFEEYRRETRSSYRMSEGP